MRFIDGRTIAAGLLASLKERVAGLPSKPGLAAVLVGDDPASHLYVNLKEQACQDIGLYFSKRLFPAETPEGEVLDHLATINRDPRIHAILVQLPLPKQLDEDRVIAAIDPNKDVDGFQPANVRRFLSNEPNALTPVLTKAIGRLLEATGVSLEGKTAAVRSNSPVFAEPLIAFLRRQGITARFIPPRRWFRPSTNSADILIVALGTPGAITDREVKAGAIVIDIGTTQVGKNVVGDVDVHSVENKAAWLTPVPGGVGPVTVACLLENVLELAARPKR